MYNYYFWPARRRRRVQNIKVCNRLAGSERLPKRDHVTLLQTWNCWNRYVYSWSLPPVMSVARFPSSWTNWTAWCPGQGARAPPFTNG